MESYRVTVSLGSRLQGNVILGNGNETPLARESSELPPRHSLGELTPLGSTAEWYGANAAKIPGRITVVSLNNPNGGNPNGSNVSNPQYSVNNDLSDGTGHLNTETDGMTVLLSVRASVTRGMARHFRLAIADVGDHIGGSYVFLKAGSFIDAPSDLDGGGVADDPGSCLHASNQGSPDQLHLSVIEGPNTGYDCGSSTVRTGNIKAHQDEL